MERNYTGLRDAIRRAELLRPGFIGSQLVAHSHDDVRQANELEHLEIYSKITCIAAHTHTLSLGWSCRRRERCASHHMARHRNMTMLASIVGNYCLGLRGNIGEEAGWLAGWLGV